MNQKDIDGALASLHRDGFAILPVRVSEHLIDTAVAEIRGKYSYDQVHYNLNNRIENAWKFSNGVRDIAGFTPVLRLLDQYFTSAPFAFQTLNFEKGSSQRLHSDDFHFSSSRPMEMVGAWVALESVHPDSGPLEVCVGSHKLPFLYPDDFGCAVGSKAEPYKYYSQYEDHIALLQAQHHFERRAICLEKGQVLVWSSNLLHGGSKIVDPSRTRFSQVTHYFARGNRYFSPITSGKGFFRKSYRFPYDVSTGKRVIPFLR